MDNLGMSGAPTTSHHTSSLRPVLIAGGGIGGMATALTLHQIGVPCIVFETVPELQPLGVGINLQPNAVRELHDLGFGNDVLDTIGLQARNGRWWAATGTRCMPSRAGWRRATTGRNIQCTGVSCR